MDNKKIQTLIIAWQAYASANVKKAFKTLEFNYSGFDEITSAIKNFYRAQLSEVKGQLKLLAVFPLAKKTLTDRLSAKCRIEVLDKFKASIVKKKKIAYAVCFWAYVRKQVSIEDRREFLAEFLSDDNQYIAIIAYIESLPDMVWRKLLWRENIDFMSYEACLRRLTSEQRASIVTAYNELYAASPVIPAVCNATWIDQLKNSFTGLTPEKVMNSAYGHPERYFSKGAWAYNLLDLDFGFSLHPNGVKDDTEIANKSITRFLSVKEHINDFVVNLEDGKYWALYRTARSNYAWLPWRKVELKTHICPGFWATLLMHLIFWVISPIVFATQFHAWASHGYGAHLKDLRYLIPFIASCFPTALIVSIAAIRFTIEAIMWLIVYSVPKLVEAVRGVAGVVADKVFDRLETIEKWWDENEVPRELTKKVFHFIYGTAKMFIYVSVLLVALIIVIGGIENLKQDVLVLLGVTRHSLQFAGMFLVLTLFWLYTRWMFSPLKDKELPTPIQVALVILITFPLLQITNKHAVPFIIQGLIAVLNYGAGALIAIGRFVRHETLLFIWMITGGFAILFPALSFNLVLKNEESFAKLDRYINRTFFVWLVATCTIGFFVMRNGDFYNMGEQGPSMVFMLNICGFMLLGVLYMITRTINTETIEDRKIAEVTAASMKFEWTEGSRDQTMTLDSKKVRKNKWLLSLSKEAREAFIKRFSKLLMSSDFFIYAGESAYKAGNELIQVIDLKMLDSLQKVAPKIKNLNTYSKKRLMMLLVDGYSITDALNTVNAEVVAYQEKQQRKAARAKYRKELLLSVWNGFIRFLKLFSWVLWIFAPVVLLGALLSAIGLGLAKMVRIIADGLWRVFNYLIINPCRKVYQYSSTLKALWILFNERCPYVSKPKFLE